MPVVMMQAPEPLATATFLTLTLGLAGIAHVLWLKSRYSQRWQQPLDAGLHVRGKRLFGPHKTLRGLLVLPPATACTFLLFSLLRPYLPEWLVAGMWPMTHLAYSFFGFLSGLVFMLAELPNSLIKRQLGIASGQTAKHPILRRLFMIIDRCDSEIGVLILISAYLPVTLMTWVWTLVLGVGLHAGFSYLLYLLGIKDRAL